MANRIENGVDTVTRELVWVDDDLAAQEAFWEEVRSTDVARQFLRDYGATSSNNQRIGEIVEKLNPDVEHFTTGMYVDALKVAMNAGELDRKPVEEEPAVEAPVEVPRDRNGRPLSTAQIAWGEMTRWAEAASSRDIAERRRSDPAFAKFYLACLKQEMNVEIDGDVRPFNPHMKQKQPSQAAMHDQKLIEFASRWRSLSAEEIRKSRRFDTSPLTAQTFLDQESACIKAGLI
jgi:hypothetical protein